MSETYTAKQYGYEQPVLAVVVPLTVMSLAVIFLVAGNGDGSLWAAILGVVIVLALLVAPLSIVVTTDHLRVRLAWLWSRAIPMNDITAVESRKYRALRQFGGWGWRIGRGGDRAYTMAGNEAAVVTLRDGSEVFLGARDTRALAQAISLRLDS